MYLKNVIEVQMIWYTQKSVIYYKNNILLLIALVSRAFFPLGFFLSVFSFWDIDHAQHPDYRDNNEGLAWLHFGHMLLKFSWFDSNWSNDTFCWLDCFLSGLEIYQVQLNVFFTEEKDL